MNVFFDLKISICYYITEGWVKQHFKKETLEIIKIPLADINQPPYTDGTFVRYWNKSKNEKKIKDDKCSNIALTVTKQSSFLSNFIPPGMHYLEDNPLPDQATMHELKISFKRLKRVRILYIKFIRTIFRTFYWMYPEFTKVFIVFYSLIVLFLPSQFFLPLFFLCILIFCLLMNPKHKEMLLKVRKLFFSKKKHLVPYPRVVTIKEATHIKKSQMDIFKAQAQEGVIKRWKKFKEDAVELQNYLLLLACYGEKVRHLFLWEDPKKTQYFCIGICILIFLFICIPFRFILLAAGFHRFYKGYNYTKKKILHNRTVSEDVLNSLFNQFLSGLFIKVDSNEFWSKEVSENPGVQKKIVEGIRIRLSLDITTEIFQKCRSPYELWNYIASASLSLNLKDNKGEYVYDFYKDRQSNLLWGFLTNIPSEYYRLEHPRIADIESYY